MKENVNFFHGLLAGHSPTTGVHWLWLGWLVITGLAACVAWASQAANHRPGWQTGDQSEAGISPGLTGLMPSSHISAGCCQLCLRLSGSFPALTQVWWTLKLSTFLSESVYSLLWLNKTLDTVYFSIGMVQLVQVKNFTNNSHWCQCRSRKL